MKLFCYLLLAVVLQSCGQKTATNTVYGNWNIDRMDFVDVPDEAELKDVLRSCTNREVVITSSQFIFKANDCFLYKSINDFKVTRHYTLTLKEAQASADYADMAVQHIFDGGKRKTVDAYKTNYTFDSDEGEVPELEMFLIDNDHLIIYQYSTIVFLKRNG